MLLMRTYWFITWFICPCWNLVVITYLVKSVYVNTNIVNTLLLLQYFFMRNVILLMTFGAIAMFAIVLEPSCNNIAEKV